MTVSQRGTTGATGPVDTSCGTTTPMSGTGTWGTSQTRVAGDLLIAVLTAGGTSSVATYGVSTSGWTLLFAEAGTAAVVAFYAKIATGSDAAPAVYATTTGTSGRSSLDVTLYDFYDSSGGTPVCNISGGASGGTNVTTLTPVTAQSVPSSGCFAVAAMLAQGTTSAGNGWTTPTSDAIPRLRLIRFSMD